MKISAVILTKDEGGRIARCLEALKWCDERIVVDDNSADKTRQLARKYGARVFRRSMDNDFSKQRNFGLEKAKNDWVFFVDADELVSAELRDEILEKVENSRDIVGYKVHRKDYFLGKMMRFGEFGRLGIFGNAYILRLGKRNAGKWSRRVHEVWNVNGRIGGLRSNLFHYSHSSVEKFVEQIVFHSDMHANELRAEGKRVTFVKVIVWPVGKFVNNFFFKFGFLDGIHGFVVAVLMSFHSFLAWSKLWTR